MAFWGVEVKPGKPFTLESSEASGIKRLHISKATLGFGQAIRKSTLQCNVGEKSPILLCVLTPDKVDSCKLDLEFEEADEVIFSVIGPRSIHLAGYFIDRSTGSEQNDDKSETYGEDISYTDTEIASSDDYDYNDSFINDGDPYSRGSHVSSTDDNGSMPFRILFNISDGTSARANEDSINDDSIQVCNNDNDYKIPKVLSSEIPLNLENGETNANFDKKKASEATRHTNKTLENSETNANCKTSEATTHTHMSMGKREDKSSGDVELSPIQKGCEILSKSSVVINSEDGEEKHMPENLQNEKPATDKEIKSSPSQNATLTKKKRKMDSRDENGDVRKNLFECSESKKQATDKNIEKEDGGDKEPLESEILSNEVIIKEIEKEELEGKSEDS
ncbi:unnamed protein product [Arabis nemorensis]|uniref:peptidylprolyl isomerase n=1 Tax=Arabis nemorensis TaxID=586526 RepID=A0A565BK11_9BRAS|nr:unnamed protein product [Arabis nemorensis]